jgi:hypothetical protein
MFSAVEDVGESGSADDADDRLEVHFAPERKCDWD